MSFKVIGKIQEAHGLKGELFVHLFAKQADWLNEVKELRIGRTPEHPEKSYQLNAARVHKTGLIVRLEGVADRTAAEGLLKQYLFIDESLLVSDLGETIYLREILGFSVYDLGPEIESDIDDEIDAADDFADFSAARRIGIIEGFSSNGPQDLLVVRREESRQAVEIPFVEAFLIEIDFEAKKMLMQLPEGLIDEET